LAFEQGSPHAGLIGVLRPAPAVEGADVVLAIDPTRAGVALGAWLGPHLSALESVWTRELDLEIELPDALDGTLAVFTREHPETVVVFGVQAGRALEWERLLNEVVDAGSDAYAEAEPNKAPPQPEIRQREDGATELFLDGEVWLTAGQIDDVAWIAEGEIAVPPGDLCLRMSEAIVPDAGPGLRIQPQLPSNVISAEVFGDGNVLRLRIDVEH
jgi:hypothetical protein